MPRLKNFTATDLETMQRRALGYELRRLCRLAKKDPLSDEDSEKLERYGRLLNGSRKAPAKKAETAGLTDEELELLIKKETDGT
jgi:hypothetical protein